MRRYGRRSRKKQCEQYVIMRRDSCTMPVTEGLGVSPAFERVAVRLVWCTVEKAAVLIVSQWRQKLAALHHTGRCSTKGCSLRCKTTSTMRFSCCCMVSHAASARTFSLDYVHSSATYIGVIAPLNAVSRLRSTKPRLHMLIHMAA